MKFSLRSSNVSKLEISVYVLVTTFLALSFQQSDLLHTAGSSLTFLFHSWRDYYDVNHEIWGYNHYPPSIYFVFAIWNYPLKALGFVDGPTFDFHKLVALMPWFKTLLIVAFLASLRILWAVLKEIEINNELIRLSMWSVSLQPAFYFIQFIFAQYDILMLPFILWGLLLLIQGKSLKSGLAFGLASTFKYFPAFAFFPLLLLMEKNFFKLFGAALIFVIPGVLMNWCFYDSQAYRQDVLGFSLISKVYEVSINLGGFQLPILPIAWMVFCGFCYFYRPPDRAVFIKRLPTFALMGSVLPLFFMEWNPQWMLIPLFFFAVGAALSPMSHRHFNLSLLMGIFFIGYCVHRFPFNVDMFMLNQGIWRAINEVNQDVSTMFEFKKIFPFESNFYKYGIYLFFVLHVWMKFNESPRSVDSRGAGRFLLWRSWLVGCGVFFVPALGIFFISALPPVKAQITQRVLAFSEEMPPHFPEYRGRASLRFQFIDPVSVKFSSDQGLKIQLLRVMVDHEGVGSGLLKLSVYEGADLIFEKTDLLKHVPKKDYWHVDIRKKMNSEWRLELSTQNLSSGEKVFLFEPISQAKTQWLKHIEISQPFNFRIYARLGHVK